MKKKQTKKALVAELKELLVLETGREDEGVLTMAGRQLTGDLQQRKIARVKEILEKI